MAAREAPHCAPHCRDTPQALLSSFTLVLFLLTWENPPAAPGMATDGQKQPTTLAPPVAAGADSAEAEHSSALAQLRTLASNRQFLLQSLCHSTLTGVSFTLPAVQNEVVPAFLFISRPGVDVPWCRRLLKKTHLSFSVSLALSLTLSKSLSPLPLPIPPARLPSSPCHRFWLM